MELSNKNILFFSPKAFGYENAIRLRLEQLGAIVDYFDDRPSNGFWGKAILRVKRNLMKMQIEKYYQHLFQQLSGIIYNYDYIFLLNLEAMPIWFLKKICDKKSKNTSIILYMWDSFNNKPNTKDYISLCDRVITFDSSDQQNDHRIEFRPLFYLNKYATIANQRNYLYDLSFIATAHSDRFIIAKKVKEQIEQKNRKTFFYFFLQSKKLFLYQKIMNHHFKNAKMSDFRYWSLPSNMVLEIVSKSKAILDIQHPKQIGLTMRTIEVLGAERKLITTNTTIKDYDFYNPQNILIIDRENPTIDDDFFDSPYCSIDKDLYYKYSLDGWLDYIFSKQPKH